LIQEMTMPARAVVTALIASLLFAAAPASAQEKYGDLIFEAPVNLTKLSPSITKVAVECNVKGAGITVGTAAAVKDTFTKRVEVPVNGGQVVGSLQVVFPASLTAGIKAGTAISYDCGLLGLAETKPATGGTAKQEAGGSAPDRNKATWKTFESRNGPAFTLSERLEPITGNFKW
jgi:hypothetical protein